MGNSTMKIICISGHAQHGKDTTALYMNTALQDIGSVLIIHYADLLKYICSQYFGWDGRKNSAGRTLLQYVGTDVVRKKAPDFWVDFVSSMLTVFGENWDYVLIPDCRFPNEIDRLKECGFDVTHVRVIRSGFNSPLSQVQQTHPSETALDTYPTDYILHNDSTLQDLRVKVNDLLQELVFGHQLSFSEVLACAN